MGRFTMFWMEGRSTPSGGIVGSGNGKWITTALTHTETTYGFGLAHSDWSDPKWASQLALEFPMWFGTTVFAVLPLVWLLTRRRRRLSAGSCARCGYDLTANASGTCPECGTVIPAVANAKERLLSAARPDQPASYAIAGNRQNSLGVYFGHGT
jgi:hypothetical protein